MKFNRETVLVVYGILRKYVRTGEPLNQVRRTRRILFLSYDDDRMMMIVFSHAMLKKIEHEEH